MRISEERAYAIHQSGRWYTNENIDRLQGMIKWNVVFKKNWIKVRYLE